MRTLTFSLFAILVLALVARCSPDPVAPDLADPGSIELAADETPRGLLALINRLERERGLTQRQADWLRERLKEAVRFEDSGRPERADRVFGQMIQQVGKWRNQGQVTAVVADEIITYLQGVLGHKFASISAGRYHSCGVRPTGAAYCWGNSNHGQLGDGGPGVPGDDSDIPVKVVGGHTFASISAGGDHTCGVTASTGHDPGGVAYCWGLNSYGGLGNGSNSDSSIPVKVVGGLTFASISAGLAHTCGVTTAGTGYCWGWNEYGQLGNGTKTDYNVPYPVSGRYTFALISAGRGHTCGLTTTGTDYCWGDNASGQLGNGTNVSSNVPVAVLTPKGTTFAYVDAYLSTCGVTTAGVGYCWGFNGEGQLGDGTNDNSGVPVAVAGGHTFASIDAGVSTCGVTTAGVGYCWGFNEDGQLGNGTTTDSNFPVAVAGGHTWASISAGGHHNCGVTTAQVAYCWGENGPGELGDGTNIDSNVPVAVAKP